MNCCIHIILCSQHGSSGRRERMQVVCVCLFCSFVYSARSGARDRPSRRHPPRHYAHSARSLHYTSTYYTGILMQHRYAFRAFLIAVVYHLSTDIASGTVRATPGPIQNQNWPYPENAGVTFSYKYAKLRIHDTLETAIVTFLFYCYFPKRLGALFLKRELKCKLVLF